MIRRIGIAFACTILSFTYGNAQTYIWTQLPDFGGGNRYVPFAFAINGKGYAGSGVTFTGSTANYTATDLWEFDPSTNLWTQKADMPDPCRSSAAAFSAMGGGYVTTGYTPTPVKTTYRYDPVLNNWTQRADFGGTARYTAAAFSIGDDAFVGMGYSPLLKDFWKYDSHSDTWTQVANVGGTARQSAVGFAINNIGYVYGGAYNGGVSAELWAYNPSNNTWTQRSNMPGSGRYGASAVVVDGNGVVGLGTNGTTIFSDFYAYDPVSNSWSSVPSLPAGARYGGASFSISNQGYFVGGAGSFTPTANLKNDLWVLSMSPVAIIVSHEPTSCAGDTIKLTAATNSSYTYQWQLNYTDIPGATSFEYDATVPGDYTVVVTNASGSSTSPAVSVPSLPIPGMQLSISVAGTNLCSGITLTANSTPAASGYQWMLNGVNISGATSQVYQPTVAGNYSFSAQSSCGTMISAPVAVSSGSGTLPTNVNLVFNGTNGSIYNGTVYACYANYPLIFNCTAQNATSYQWYRNGVLISGATNSSYSVPVPGSYTCAAINGCGSVTSAVLAAGEITQPQPVLNTVGYPNTCNGSAVQLEVYDPGFLPFVSYTYSWTLNGNAIPGNNLPVLNATSPGVYRVTVVNNCGWNSSPDKTVISDSPLSPVITPSGSTTICSTSGSVVLSTQNVSGYQYQWKLNNVAISGAIYSSYTATQGGNYTVDVTNACGTFTSPAQAVSFVSAPTGFIIFTGSPGICPGGSKLLTCNTTGTVTGYQWKLNGTNISGATASTYNATQVGSYSCTITNGVCNPVTTSSISLVALSLPNATITANGSTTFCSGGSVALSVASVSGQTYQWFKNGAAVSGATSNTYTATTAGSWSVQVTNSCGTSTSTTVTTVVNPNPGATIAAGGATSFCQGGSVTLTAPSGTGLAYQWMKNGVNISGATAITYAANTSGTYTVRVTNTATGCFAVTPSGGAIQVTVNPLPGATITPSGTVTFCAGQSVLLSANTGTGYTYQWRRNNKKIVGATSSTYNVTTAAKYKVIVTGPTGCVSTSADVTAVINCREMNPEQLSMHLSPNPTTENFVVSVDSPYQDGMTIEVYDLFGKLVAKANVNDSQTSFETSEWPAGIYLVKLVNASGMSQVSRLIKSN
jgi:N-acetylneuraminic acid mutarotase